MNDGLLITALSILPRRRLSRWMGRTASATLSRSTIRAFVWWYQIDLSELDRPLTDFPTLQDFFRRPLPSGARPIANADLVSPVDGTLSGAGPLRGGHFPQSTTHQASVTALLGRAAPEWSDGGYAVLYLSPRDYHRVHAPFSGTITRMAHHPGERWPVFRAAVQRIPRLFEGNERLVIELETPTGPAAVVLIGALGVGEITTTLSPGDRVAPGDEVGCFGFGSTVIVLHPNTAFCDPGPMRVGQRLSRLTAQSDGSA